MAREKRPPKKEVPMIDTFETLLEDVLKLGVPRAIVVNPADIVFREEFRRACERNACGRYGTNWMGPPAVGQLNDLMARARCYKEGLLFQTVHPVSRSFDMKGMEEGGKAFDEVFRKILRCMKEKYGILDILPLGAGCCRICEKCACLDREPCRHPDDALSSLEAYGMDVMTLARETGMPYNNGPKTVTFFGLILFNTSGE
jgi:predicted metal-binding protein